MPPQPLLDLSGIDPSRLVATREQIQQVNPHRFEFQQLDGILLNDHANGLMAGLRDLRPDEFWVRGHIPGRPIYPGVLIIECAAQLVSYHVGTMESFEGFIGFGGVDGVKFRGQVKPGDRMIMLGKMLEVRGRRRCVAATQGFVGDQMIYEGTITGMII
jgi:3-hydroxyacyl-[acyl-carrier-protein] dehydratase